MPLKAAPCLSSPFQVEEYHPKVTFHTKSLQPNQLERHENLLIGNVASCLLTRVNLPCYFEPIRGAMQALD